MLIATELRTLFLDRGCVNCRSKRKMFGFGKKKSEEELPGAPVRLDNLEKSRVMSGDLYGMHSNDLDMPASPTALRPSVAPPLPGAPDALPNMQAFPPTPGLPDLPKSAPMGPSQYDMPAPMPNSGPAPIPQQMNNMTPLPKAVNLPAEPVAPAPSHSNEDVEMLTEDLEKIAESIINQKLQGAEEVISKIEEVQKVFSEVENLKQTIAIINEKVNSLQTSIMGKVQDYNKSINDVNAELAAVGKVFEKLIPEFTRDVRDLSGIVDKKLSSKRRRATKKQEKLEEL